MARKKTSKASKPKKVVKKELLASPSSYRSLLFGIITVVVLFLVGIAVFQFIQNRQGDINGDGLSTEQIDEALKNASSYTVQPSDTLWSIAEKELGSGDAWPKIADVNNIKSPEDLEEGTKLTIPARITPTSTPTIAVQQPIEEETVIRVEETEEASEQKQEAASKTYVIKRGDTLWSIAVALYGDGYKWVDLANANDLENNPDLIHADNTIVIP